MYSNNSYDNIKDNDLTIIADRLSGILDKYRDITTLEVSPEIAPHLVEKTLERIQDLELELICLNGKTESLDMI